MERKEGKIKDITNSVTKKNKLKHSHPDNNG